MFCAGAFELLVSIRAGCQRLFDTIGSAQTSVFQQQASTSLPHITTTLYAPLVKSLVANLIVIYRVADFWSNLEVSFAIRRLCLLLSDVQHLLVGGLANCVKILVRLDWVTAQTVAVHRALSGGGAEPGTLGYSLNYSTLFTGIPVLTNIICTPAEK